MTLVNLLDYLTILRPFAEPSLRALQVHLRLHLPLLQPFLRRLSLLHLAAGPLLVSPKKVWQKCRSFQAQLHRFQSVTLVWSNHIAARLTLRMSFAGTATRFGGMGAGRMKVTKGLEPNAWWCWWAGNPIVPVLSWFLHQTYAKMTLAARPLPSSEAESGTLHWRRRLHPGLSVSPEHLGHKTLHFWVSTYNIYNNTFANQLPDSGWTCKAAHLFQPGGLPKLLESTKAHSSADNFGKSARPQWSTAWPTPGHGAGSPGSPWRRFQLGGTWRPQKKMTKVQPFMSFLW